MLPGLDPNGVPSGLYGVPYAGAPAALNVENGGAGSAGGRLLFGAGGRLLLLGGIGCCSRSCYSTCDWVGESRTRTLLTLTLIGAGPRFDPDEEPDGEPRGERGGDEMEYKFARSV